MFLGYLIIGLLAGWVASKIVRGRGSGLVVNLAVGLVGGILGGWLVSLIGWIPMGSFGSLADVDCRCNRAPVAGVARNEGHSDREGALRRFR